jgi:hypothetical protein
MIGTIIGLMEPPSVPAAAPLHAQKCLQTGRNSVSDQPAPSPTLVMPLGVGSKA